MNACYTRSFFIGLTATVLIASPCLLFADMYDMVLDISGAARQRPPVDFSHEFHMDTYDCLDCHHDYADGENILDPGDLEEGNPDIRCIACHKAGAKIDAQKAYHRQCTGCHTLVSKSEKKSLPLYCGECHQSTE